MNTGSFIQVRALDLVTESIKIITLGYLGFLLFQNMRLACLSTYIMHKF